MPIGPVNSGKFLPHSTPDVILGRNGEIAMIKGETVKDNERKGEGGSYKGKITSNFNKMIILCTKISTSVSFVTPVTYLQMAFL